MPTDRKIILVSGANGRIGHSVMTRFASRGEQMIGFDRKATKPAPEGCTYISVDMSSDDSVREGIDIVRKHHGTQVASVVHLAAYYDFFGRPSPKYEEITVQGTARLLRELHVQEFEVEQFIFSSTMLIHRPADPGEFITEDWPIEPTWAYPESKVRTEKAIHDGRGSIPAVLLRIAGVYDDGCHSIPIAHQIQRIYEHDLTSRVYSGSTAHGQSFLHMDDLVDALELAVDRRATLPVEIPILLGEPEPLTYDELQHSIARLIGAAKHETVEVPLVLAPVAKLGAWVLDHVPGPESFIKPWMIDRANDHYALDITRATTLLGWKPTRSLRATLPKMVEALKTDPKAFYSENDLTAPGDEKKDSPNPPSPSADEKDDAARPSTPPAASATRPVIGAFMTMPDGQMMAVPDAHEAQHETKVNETEESKPDDRMMTMPDGSQMAMPGGDQMKMPDTGRDSVAAPMQMEMQGAIWPHFANMFIGLWLLTSAFALGYGSFRLQASDIVSGSVIILLAGLSLSRAPFWKFWAPWANSLVGVWLLFAPLIYWAPTAAAYANDTLVGALVVVFAILAPGMPMPEGMSMTPGPERPQGWSYNPSSWSQRAPIILLALVGFFLSRQMAAFELKHVTTLADPFFGMGTQTVLTSEVSKAFPIADAGLGAAAYMVEFLMGFMGDKCRWRTMPWMVTFFGILVVPLGVVSIGLIILQPLAVGAWCTPCLLAAVAMLVMISLTLDEVVAMVQFLTQSVREGQPFWNTFWRGGALRAKAIEQPFHADDVSASAMAWGVAMPWTLMASIALGVWLMVAPYVLGTTGSAAHSDHLLGALIVTTAVIALADVGRASRYLNIVLALWVIVAPWILAGSTSGSSWNAAIVGALIIALSLPRGTVGEQYGSWQPYIR